MELFTKTKDNNITKTATSPLKLLLSTLKFSLTENPINVVELAVREEHIARKADKRGNPGPHIQTTKQVRRSSMWLEGQKGTAEGRGTMRVEEDRRASAKPTYA